MNLKQNRNDIIFLEWIIKWSSVFCITPWYNFHRQKLICQNLFKVYAVAITIFLLLTFPVLTYIQLTIIFNYIPITLTTIFTFLEVNTLIFWIIINLGSAFWNKSTWERIFRYSHHLEVKNCVHGGETKIITNANFIFILGNAYFVLVFICYQVLSFGRHDVLHVVVSIHKVTYFYLEFLLSNIICNMALSIKSKYKAMNETIVSMKAKEGRRNLESIQKTHLFFVETNDIVEDFNRLFGCPLVFVLIHFVLDVLNAINLTIAIFPYNITETVLLLFFYGIITKVWPVAIIFCCDSVIQEAAMLLTTCYQVEALVPLLDKEKDELRSLKDVIKTRGPKFTVAEFFEIKKSTLLSILSTITAYLIVIIQFNSL